MSAAGIRNLVLGGLLIGAALTFLYFARGFLIPESQPVAVASETSGEPRTTAYVTARPVPRGQSLTAEDLKTIVILGSAPEGLVTHMDQAVGRVVLEDTAQGQLILVAAISDNPADAGLAPLIPVGQRAYNLRIDETIASGDFLRPGDRVDILLVLNERALGRSSRDSNLPPELQGNQSEALPLLQNVTLLTVGDALTLIREEEEEGRRESRRRAIRTLSVALAPEEGAILTLARELGEYAIALRNPDDTVEVERRSVTIADIRQRLGVDAGFEQLLEERAAAMAAEAVAAAEANAAQATATAAALREEIARADGQPVRPPPLPQPVAAPVPARTQEDLAQLLAEACPDPVSRNILFLNGLERSTQVVMEEPDAPVQQ